MPINSDFLEAMYRRKFEAEDLMNRLKAVNKFPTKDALLCNTQQYNIAAGAYSTLSCSINDYLSMHSNR